MALLSPQTLNLEQENALKQLSSGVSAFVTGAAGTGKSTLVSAFRKTTRGSTLPVVASTGSAALLHRGRTFHSYFGLGILEGGVSRTVERALKNRKVIKRLEDSIGIIIDEISMIPGAALDAAEMIARKIRENDSPWGGLQVVAVGDFWQLPPVTKDGERDWAFRSIAWEKSEFLSIRLEKCLRTAERDYLSALAQIRVGEVDDRTNSFFRSRVSPKDDPEAIYLFPHRASADRYNDERLAKLKGEAIQFSTRFTGKTDKFIDDLKRQIPIAETLVLKPGARVILVQNDPRGRFVNGSQGSLVSANDDSLEIKLDSGGTVHVEKTTFESIDEKENVIAAATNFPVRLGYGATIHRAQGMTLDRLRVDLSRAWEHGQAYVALSRVRESAHLTLSGWNPRSVVVDPEVAAFEFDSSDF